MASEKPLYVAVCPDCGLKMKVYVEVGKADVTHTDPVAHRTRRTRVMELVTYGDGRKAGR